MAFQFFRMNENRHVSVDDFPQPLARRLGERVVQSLHASSRDLGLLALFE